MKNPSNDAATQRRGALRSMVGLNLTQSLVPLLVRTAGVPSAALTLGRCIVAATILLVIAKRKGLRVENSRTRTVIALCGLLLAAHWALLFQAFRTTTVAMAQVCCFTYPVMTSLLEPWIQGKRPRGPQVLAALGVLAGVAAMQRGHEGEAGTLAGSLMALASAFLFAVRNILSRWTVRSTDGILVMGGQAAVAALVLLPFAGGLKAAGITDLLVILALGSVTTAWPHTVMIQAMRHLPAAAVSILSTLQVPLSLILAWFLLGEKLGPWGFLGAFLVLGSVIFESLGHWRQKPAE